MAEYKYTSNKDSQDGTEAIGVPGGELVKQGETLELTDEQVSELRQKFNLHKVDGSDEAPADAEAPAEAQNESSKPARG